MTSTPTTPTTKTLYLLIEGNEVTLTGTEKGNPTHQALTPRPWVWSRRAAGYVLPRSLLPGTRHDRVQELRRAAEAAQIPLEVEDTHEGMTEDERRQDRHQRLAERAERHSDSADRASARAEAAAAASARISYPLGQPILIGHHSEGRHRRDLARKDRYDTQYVTETRTARRRNRLARQLREHLDRGDGPVTIRLRIERTAAELRRLGRILLTRPTDRRTWAEINRLTQALNLDRDAIAHLETHGLTHHLHPRERQGRGPGPTQQPRLVARRRGQRFDAHPRHLAPDRPGHPPEGPLRQGHRAPAGQHTPEPVTPPSRPLTAPQTRSRKTNPSTPASTRPWSSDRPPKPSGRADDRHPNRDQRPTKGPSP